MSASRSSIAGQLAEDAAANYLTTAGLTLRERNFQCRAGEIDLILTDHQTLVFAEVRLRQHTTFGGALGSVDHRKQQRLCATALAFSAARCVAPHTPMRFDVIAVSGQPTPGFRFEWIRDAFQCD